MKLVQCPICYLSVDIENLPEGSKVRCEKCQKIIGLIQGNTMLPAVLSRAARKQATNVKLEECPTCKSKIDIANLPNGSKVRCEKCRKVIGIIEDYKMLPTVLFTPFKAQASSSKLITCPKCNSKFDITNIPEGTKLKCNQCKEIFGMIRNGQMVPIESTPALEPIPEPEPNPVPEPAPKLVSEVKAEVVPETEKVFATKPESVPKSETHSAIKQRVGEIAKKKTTLPVRDSKIRKSSNIPEAPAIKSKPTPLLYAAAFIAIISIVAFVYILIEGGFLKH